MSCDQFDFPRHRRLREQVSGMPLNVVCQTRGRQSGTANETRQNKVGLPSFYYWQVPNVPPEAFSTQAI